MQYLTAQKKIPEHDLNGAESLRNQIVIFTIKIPWDHGNCYTIGIHNKTMLYFCLLNANSRTTTFDLGAHCGYGALKFMPAVGNCLSIMDNKCTSKVALINFNWLSQDRGQGE
jgi:hypothetical protein